MMKYCFITDEESGLVQLGVGCSDEYYIEIGMELRDVEQSEIDSQWYLTDKCPHYTPEEKLQNAKVAKYEEANNGAREFIESGNALFEFDEGKHVEATDGNIGKFTAYAWAYIRGKLQPEDTVVWNTKEDENVELDQEAVETILDGLGQVQANVWAVKYAAYAQAIKEAETIEEVEAIVIKYEEDDEN